MAAVGQSWHERLDPLFGTLLVINVAVGVVTGLVQEFEFGMNWSTYSTFVGNVFGAPLAMEGLAAFFLESTFLGLWLFGWGRLPKRVHLAWIWAVAAGSAGSALFIMAANSWMQHPVGYKLVNGQAQLTDISALFTNPVFHLGVRPRAAGGPRHRVAGDAGGLGLPPAPRPPGRGLPAHDGRVVGGARTGEHPRPVIGSHLGVIETSATSR